MFGIELERIWGTPFFVNYYAVTGVGAAITTILVSLLPFGFTSAMYGVVTIGASGALYGLLLAFALYYPTRPILMMLIFPIPAKYFVMIIGAMSLLFSIEGRRRRALRPPRRPAVRLRLPQGGRGGLTAEINTAISNGR